LDLLNPKDWVIEQTTYKDEASALALAHISADKTRDAYAQKLMSYINT